MNFDKIVDRNNTNCLKYDLKEENIPNNVFPMWIADMDFRCCDEILEDLHDKIDHGIFGYSMQDFNYYMSIENWYKANFNTFLNKDWLVTTPGIVFAIATAIKSLTNENDFIIINEPVYNQFKLVAKNNNRQIISSDLVLKDGHYEIDFIDFENKIKEFNVKLYILCSPHNPVGRVWTSSELDKIVEICKRNNVYIIADEIHSDFVWNKNKHTCLLNYSNYLDNMIVCTAPTKTFNLSGLQVSNIFIPNENIRQKFNLEKSATGYGNLNIMSIIACQSAYNNGQKWLKKLKKYLQKNINYVDTFLSKKLPKIKLIYPEGTYLLWLDFNELNLSDEELEDIILNKAKLWLDNGTIFGEAGSGFERINIALPQKNLKKALKRLEKAFKKY